MTLGAIRLAERRLAGLNLAGVPVERREPFVPFRDIDAVGVRESFAKFGMCFFEPRDPAFAVDAKRLLRVFLEAFSNRFGEPSPVRGRLTLRLRVVHRATQRP